MSTGLYASQAASKGASGSFSSGYMSMPPTRYRGFEHGYIRLGHIPHESFGLKRNRYRPIMTFGNPADFVGGPRNAGDSATMQHAQGGGSFATATQKT
ncbi:MAG: hypothetical protein H6860_04440 [Rhodospirillales bacterium]|nr:hypothetical protein [Alphaproteobacteria bacterium]MCB9981629.1 hypothetical protein [Rhodospirillales bacterium]